ncbi:hypothetical protein [Nocardiopsis metallicus]|uniref:Uncharacterized protein n=1 Tax=Nocardiopsis metallicus TaxID=179819 RepID=A0A840W5P1_9ACTN|nr:hypothetical protein [Nocardiopsis metallicus]MBB5490663.1 hypothetical protein [Nocardiopsis metallicus]
MIILREPFRIIRAHLVLNALVYGVAPAPVDTTTATVLIPH